MAQPVIKIKCEIDEDYVKRLDKCIEDGKKLVIDGAIDRSVSVIEEEDLRKLVRERANKLFGEVVEWMEKVREELRTIEHSSSVVVYDSEETDYGSTFLKDIRFIDEFKEVVEDENELKSALEKFLEVNEWLDVPYEEKYIDEDGEEEYVSDKYGGHPSKINVDSELRYLLEDLLTEDNRFYVD